MSATTSISSAASEMSLGTRSPRSSDWTLERNYAVTDRGARVFGQRVADHINIWRVGCLSVLSMIPASLHGVQEDVAEVRAMNARVTADTRLTLRRLEMRRHCSETRSGVRRRVMALSADRIHIGLNQKPGIRSAVRIVTGTAPFGLDRSMLIKKWSSRRDVAFGAHHELPGSRWERILPQPAVRIVTVSAVDQALSNVVAVWRRELWIHIAVALKAKSGLRRLEQIPGAAGRMNDMTADAAYIAFAVDRAFKV